MEPMMPKASEIAQELRKIADALDLNPEVEVKRPTLDFSYWDKSEKEIFLATARILPRPVAKKYPKDQDSFSRVSVSHENPAVLVVTSIYREAICNLITPARPAVYDCEMTLLDHEDAALTEA
jgi:hypothetical protein